MLIGIKQNCGHFIMLTDILECSLNLMILSESYHAKGENGYFILCLILGQPRFHPDMTENLWAGMLSIKSN